MKIGEIYNQVINEAEGNVFYHGSPYEFDRFDINRVGSGDGMSKFGYGLYFSDNEQTAMYYAKELSKGSAKVNGFNLYTVKIYNLDSFYEWEEPTDDGIAHCIIRKLAKKGHPMAETIQQEFEEYDRYWELRNMYGILTDILGSEKETSDFLSICGMGGVIGESPAHNGKVYTVYDDSLIKIIDVTKIR